LGSSLVANLARDCGRLLWPISPEIAVVSGRTCGLATAATLQMPALVANLARDWGRLLWPISPEIGVVSGRTCGLATAATLPEAQDLGHLRDRRSPKTHSAPSPHTAKADGSGVTRRPPSSKFTWSSSLPQPGAQRTE
jgi:hypothetical protein